MSTIEFAERIREREGREEGRREIDLSWSCQQILKEPMAPGNTQWGQEPTINYKVGGTGQGLRWGWLTTPPTGSSQTLQKKGVGIPTKGR